MWLFRIRERNAGYEGIIRVRAVPFETEAEFAYWWLPERNSDGVEVRPPRIRYKERDRYSVAEFHNKITIAGKSAILTYMSIGAGTPPPYNAFFAVGSGVVTGIQPTDTQVVNELFRVAPTGYTLAGNQADVSIYFGPLQAVGTYTNAGYYGGNGATPTTGTGTLMTHTLYAFSKPMNQPVVNDYLVTQN